MRDRLCNEYFEWLSKLACGQRFSKQFSYRKLLTHLHCIAFRYSIPMDQNRAEDGIELRYRFALFNGYEDSPEVVLHALDGPCSVLEMLIALAIRCEEDIMDDPRFGCRIEQWFWGMITSLGIGTMHDNKFDEKYVEDVIARFMDREYEPDGRGGLFTIKHCEHDLRDAEIWHQLCWYVDSIADF